MSEFLGKQAVKGCQESKDHLETQDCPVAKALRSRVPKGIWVSQACLEREEFQARRDLKANEATTDDQVRQESSDWMATPDFQD